MAEESESHEGGDEGENKEKKPSTLESAIDEIFGFGKKVLTIGAIAALPLAYSLIGMPSHVARAATTTVGFAAGTATVNLMQKKPALEGTLKEGINGAILSYPLAEIFKGTNNLENVVSNSYGAIAGKTAKIGAWLGAGMPAVVGIHTGLKDGVNKKFWENYKSRLKDVYKYGIAFASAVNVAFLYQFGLYTQMAVSAAVSYFYSMINALKGGKGSIKNLVKSFSPKPYIEASGELVKKSYDLLKEPFYAVKRITDGLNEWYKSAPKTAEPEPAH